MCHFIILFFQKYRRMRIFISGTLLFCFSGGYVAYIAALFFTFSSHILVGGTVDHAARRLPLYRHFCLVVFLFLFVYFLLFPKIRYLRRTGKWIPRKHIQRLPIWNVLRIGNNYLQDSLSLSFYVFLQMMCSWSPKWRFYLLGEGSASKVDNMFTLILWYVITILKNTLCFN